MDNYYSGIYVIHVGLVHIFLLTSNRLYSFSMPQSIIVFYK